MIGTFSRSPTVDAATTGNITLSGPQTIDGEDLLAGQRCLAWQQTDATENGVYEVRTGTWVLIGQLAYVFVKAGGSYGAAVFMLTGEDEYTQASGASNSTRYADAASTANLTLSGLQTVDSVSLTAGMYCLAKNQTTAADRDLYKVAAGAWSRIGTAAAPVPSVHVLNGTAGGRLVYSLSGTTYSANRAVYG